MTSCVEVPTTTKLCLKVFGCSPLHVGVRRDALRRLQLQAARQADHDRRLLRTEEAIT